MDKGRCNGLLKMVKYKEREFIKVIGKRESY